MGLENQELISDGTDQKKLGKEWEIIDVLNQVPKFNISDLKKICEWLSIDQIQTKLPEKIEEFDNELSIDNFFIETEEDVNFIIELSKKSRRGSFSFGDKNGLIKYLEGWREWNKLSKELLKNTDKISLKIFLEIYESAIDRAAYYNMIQDRFG